MKRPILALKPKPVPGEDNAISVPEGWIKGELLNVTRFSDGSYSVMRLQDEARDPKTQQLKFDSSFATQQFVSDWYAQTFVPRGHIG
jgi:hypothetical protein